MPPEGIAIVPVGLDGTGLTPADVISVEPSGMPVGETDEPDDALPSGEVAPIVGVGTTIHLRKSHVAHKQCRHGYSDRRKSHFVLRFAPNPIWIIGPFNLAFASLHELSVYPLQTCLVHPRRGRED
jgi:hypothetical protein